MVAISTPIVYRSLAVRACHRTHGRTRYGRNPSPRRPRLMVLTIEAMKMENILTSEARGTVTSIEVGIGDNLNVDDLILSLDLADDQSAS